MVVLVVNTQTKQQNIQNLVVYDGGCGLGDQSWLQKKNGHGQPSKKKLAPYFGHGQLKKEVVLV